MLFSLLTPAHLTPLDVAARNEGREGEGKEKRKRARSWLDMARQAREGGKGREAPGKFISATQGNKKGKVKSSILD